MSIDIYFGWSYFKGERGAGMKKGKLVAPVVVTVLVCLWLLFYLSMILLVPGVPFAFKAIGGVITLGLGAVAVYNLLERIKEIRSGEEDDLDNY